MKWIHLLIIAIALAAVPACAQQTTTKKEKKVVITKKTIDENGNETVETIEAEGEDADRLLEEMEMEELEGFDMDLDRENGEDRYSFRFKSDGSDLSDFEWNGLEEMPEEMQRMLEGLNLGERFQNFEFGDLGDMQMGVFPFGGTSGGNAVLGVQVENADAMGAQVMGVSEGSAADEAGIEEGDIITSINGLEIENANTLIQKMRKYEPNERIELEVARNGKKKTMRVTLQARSY
jgi:hypothetical protein